MKQLLNSPIVLRGSKSSRSNRFDCDEELLARLASKNIVMVISPGRCGTEFLQKLLALVPDVFAAHEQEPNFETVLSRLRRNPWLAIEFCRESKLPFIASCSERNYVETSHLFGKGFFEAFLNLGLSFKLIFLHRNPRDVALSHLRV
ncbi:MAG: sulfotransferase domain-containing protein, partial [Candidatus Poribacteria bacterium]|nr:sulfotransferase domain-containing protein [Candidatus Poribacteria bacterium]